MANRFQSIKKPNSLPSNRMAPPQPAAPSQQSAAAQAAPRQQPVEIGPAQRRQLPGTFLQLEPQPLSFYDDNPVFDQISAAHLVGVTADCLKKWRQRGQGPDYIQYGTNGPVRYERNALLEFRDRHAVRPRITS
jgi:hypothetical protein